MKTLLAVAAATLLASPLTAQQRDPTFQLTPYAGYMRFGNLFSGPLGSEITNGGGPAYGAQASISINRFIGVYGNVTYATPGLEVGIPVLGGVSVGDASVLMYDGGIQLTARGRTPQQLSPFVQAGIGGMRYSFELSPLRLNTTGTAYNIGAGVDLPIGSNFGIRVLAKDYIGRFNAGELVGLDSEPKTTHNLSLSLGMTLGF